MPKYRKMVRKHAELFKFVLKARNLAEVYRQIARAILDRPSQTEYFQFITMELITFKTAKTQS